MISEITSVIQKEKLKISRQQMLLAFISGILMSVSGSVFQMDWLAWFALVPLFYSFFNFRINGKTGFQLSFICSLTYYLGLLTWLFRLHPLTWIGFSAGESILIITTGWFVFSLIESLGLSLMGYFMGLINPDGWKRALIPACLWIVIEWLQGLSDFGFTWGRLAISQYRNIFMIQSANLFGSLFITGLIVFTNAVLAIILIDYLKNREKISFKLLLSTFILLTINMVYGIYTVFTKQDSGKSVNAAIIQGNILSDEKWNMSPQDALDIYLNLSQKALQETKNKNEKIDLFVWPETAVRDYIQNAVTFNQLSAFTSLSQTYLLTGVFDVKQEAEKTYSIFNSIAGISPQGKILGVYSKQHLVPFGEYLPFRGFLQLLMPKITQINALGHDLSSGKDAGIIATPFGNIGGLICYESIFPQIIQNSINDGAELLVLVTNDSWFKDSKGVYQHNAQFVFRAVENDRYMLRAANTGVSTIISPEGRILNELGPLTKDYLVGTVKFRDRQTIYSKIGDFIAILSLIMLILFGFLTKKELKVELYDK